MRINAEISEERNTPRPPEPHPGHRSRTVAVHDLPFWVLVICSCYVSDSVKRSGILPNPSENGADRT